MERDRELEHYEWLSGCNEDGFEPEQEAETEAQRVEDAAARRVARNTTAGVKQVAAIFGVKL